MALSAGTRLGPYEVLSPLGAGGMGEVYKARDTRLGRTVAIKVLPPDAAADAAARARFEREARAIAALSHPHICVVHDVGREGDTDYLVMELLEGETLADRLAKAKGPLPLDQVFSIGMAIADALDKAHRAGIVHRDLKPANVMLTRSGPKLLDFGLAKLRGQKPPVHLSGETATTAGPATATGTILGTIYYMAPEQVEGREADARSDIWALGALLYEMATGQRPFDGASGASIVSAILKDTPPSLSTRQPLTPPALEHLVDRCLAKDADERWQDVRDVKRELQWIAGARAQQATAQPGGPGGRTGRRERVAWSLVAAMALLLAGLAADPLHLLTRQSDVRTSWLSIAPPTGQFGDWIAPAVSPDGRQVAFQAPDDAGVMRLWIRALDATAPRALPGIEVGGPSNTAPAWSPDGKSLAFFAHGQLLSVNLAGDAPQVLAGAPNPRGVAWGPGGVILFVPAPGAGVQRVAAGGGTVSRLTLSRLAEFASYPAFLPDGRHYLFSTNSAPEQDSGIFAASLDSQDVKLVAKAGPVPSLAAYALGHVFFGIEGSLYAQPFDERRLETTGEAYRVADGLGWNSSSPNNRAFSVSESGTVTYANTALSPSSRLTWLDRQGRTIGTIGEPGMCTGLAMAPDGGRVALDCVDGKENSFAIWITDVASGARSLFANENHNALTPVWAPKGDRLLYKTMRTSLVVRRLGGSVLETMPIGADVGSPWPEDWSSDGQTALFAIEDQKTLTDQWMLPMDGHSAAVPYLQTAANETQGRLSPDGHWAAYTSDESGRNEVYVQPFPTSGTKIRLSTAGGDSPTWRPDGRELFYLAPGRQLMAVALTPTAPGLAPSRPTALFHAPELIVNPRRRQFAVTADGQRFLVNAVVPATVPATLTVGLNWTPRSTP